MRIAHLTDIHFQTTPSIGELSYIKRLMGSTNLYLLGRKSKFNLETQRKSIEQIVHLNPDLVILTGDLTAQALDSEFEVARRELDPILSRYPTVIQAGNHDTYITPFPPKMRECFTPWLVNDGVDYKEYDDVGVLTIESCRPTLLSSGYVQPSSLLKATELLKQANASFIFFCMHYPLLNRHGEPYGPSTRALSNASDVMKWLSQQTKLSAYLHGHEHHGYSVDLPTHSSPIPSINPGVSGYTIDTKKQRYPHVALYEVLNGALNNIERYSLQELNRGYVLEPAPAFSSNL